MPPTLYIYEYHANNTIILNNMKKHKKQRSFEELNKKTSFFLITVEHYPIDLLHTYFHSKEKFILYLASGC